MEPRESLHLEEKEDPYVVWNWEEATDPSPCDSSLMNIKIGDIRLKDNRACLFFFHPMMGQCLPLISNPESNGI